MTDGVVDARKEREWLRRRRESLKRVRKFCAWLHSVRGQPVRYSDAVKHFVPTISSSFYLVQVPKVDPNFRTGSPHLAHLS